MKKLAIREMFPANPTLGSVYLRRFLPRLSDIKKPQRDLTRQDAEWTWDGPQQSAL